ncbi:hypothetical protein AB0H73_05810 [Streptomyces olivoreticuli]
MIVGIHAMDFGDDDYKPLGDYGLPEVPPENTLFTFNDVTLRVHHVTRQLHASQRIEYRADVYLKYS